MDEDRFMQADLIVLSWRDNQTRRMKTSNSKKACEVSASSDYQRQRQTAAVIAEVYIEPYDPSVVQDSWDNLMWIWMVFILFNKTKFNKILSFFI